VQLFPFAGLQLSAGASRPTVNLSEKCPFRQMQVLRIAGAYFSEMREAAVLA